MIKLPKLHLWTDLTPRAAALNMALDEAMMLVATEPWMRVYRWDQPSISIGFSQSGDVVSLEYEEWPVVRRWTGGGVVVHDGDWTYTLAMPFENQLSQQRAEDAYRWVHEAMVMALTEAGFGGGELQPESTSDGMGVCFIEPAKFDVVWRGNKIAGAAQRRAKSGYLHQGTIQGMVLPDNFDRLFAGQMAHEVMVKDHYTTEVQLMSAAQALVTKKYGAEDWLKHRTVATSDSEKS